ncbi:MAG: FMN-binding protein [Eubacteriaceae bacterium]|nr:FMN-binding protein [Eubacteriaceae bacterium]
MTKEIITNQSPFVDTVSGATMSSRGIIEAAADALGIQQNDTDNYSSAEGSDKTEYSDSNAEGYDNEQKTGYFADGIYTGTGKGRNGDITVNVTVSEGKVVSIEIVSSKEDYKYFQKALSVTDIIISQQSVDVDSVSGATMSSNGIRSAVADALGIENIQLAPVQQNGRH